MKCNDDDDDVESFLFSSTYRCCNIVNMMAREFDEILKITGDRVYAPSIDAEIFIDEYNKLYKNLEIKYDWPVIDFDNPDMKECAKERKYISEEEARGRIVLNAFLACHYACRAIKAEKMGKIILAWKYTVLASYEEGAISNGLLKDRVLPLPAGVAFSMMGVEARHRENRSMKAQAIEWYKNNMYTHNDEGELIKISKDKAAKTISEKVVPVEFRTARNWLKSV